LQNEFVYLKPECIRYKMSFPGAKEPKHIVKHQKRFLWRIQSDRD